jgi:hypothetical protein
LLGDKGYLFLSWLKVLHKGDRPLNPLEKLYNKRLRRGRSVVEKAFGLLKMNWRVLLTKSDLSINIISDVVCAYAIFNNMILTDRDVDVDTMIEIMQREMGNLFEEDKDHALAQHSQHLQGENGVEEIQDRLQNYLGLQWLWRV